MKTKSKIPALRFKGFTDAWEQRKLSDVANHRGGTAIEKYFDKDGVYKVISIGSYGLNSQYVDQNIRAISNEITDGRVVNSGELTMVLNDKTANGTIIGRTLLVEKDNEYVINQRTEIISPKENFDSNFAYTILNGPFREKVKRIVQGGTQIYVNYPAVSNLNLELPKIEEQQKIGSFFKQLDNTIALHQRKCEQTKELKKFMLQKMFPKKGEKNPEIRFPGFTDDWEQRKLGEIAEFNPKSDLPDEFEYVDLESVVGTEMVFHRTENKASAPSRAQRVAKTGDVFFQTVRPYQRNNYLFSMPYENYVFSTGYAQMRPKINAAFLMCFLQTESFVQNVLDNCTGTSYPAINSSDLSNLKISLPILKSEQSKIGKLISNLDHLITLHQRKCEQLKELKKFMLQNMFPKKG